MTQDRFEKVLALVERLKQAGIWHETACYREGALSVIIRVPGAYWEVDFLADGDVDVERFVSKGDIEDESALDELFAQFSEAAQEPAASHDSTAGK
jgi:hypothetical protein